MSKKNLRRVSMLIASQSVYNLERLRAMYGYHEIGQVVDKLVREKMLSLHTENISTIGREVRHGYPKEN